MLGISTDARPTQAAFSTTLGGIPYPILADFHPKGHVSRLYGVYNEEQGTPSRAVILVDKGGTVRFKMIYTEMSDLDVGEILVQVKRL